MAQADAVYDRFFQTALTGSRLTAAIGILPSWSVMPVSFPTPIIMGSNATSRSGAPMIIWGWGSIPTC